MVQGAWTELTYLITSGGLDGTACIRLQGERQAAAQQESTQVSVDLYHPGAPRRAGISTCQQLKRWYAGLERLSLDTVSAAIKARLRQASREASDFEVTFVLRCASGSHKVHHAPDSQAASPVKIASLTQGCTQTIYKVKDQTGLALGATTAYKSSTPNERLAGSFPVVCGELANHVFNVQQFDPALHDVMVGMQGLEPGSTKDSYMQVCR